jgi:hypothetical protein
VIENRSKVQDNIIENTFIELCVRQKDISYPKMFCIVVLVIYWWTKFSLRKKLDNYKLQLDHDERKIGPKVELAHIKVISWHVKVNGKLTTQ